MSKFDEMTLNETLNQLNEELTKRGFTVDSWRGESSMSRGFYSSDKLYYTRVHVFSDRIYFYKEYNCGGMISEDEYKFSDYGSPIEAIEDAFEWFYFE